MISLGNNQNIAKWADLINKGKAVRYNEKEHTFEKVGVLGRFRNFLRPKVKRQIDQKVAEVVAKELRQRFEAGERGEHYEALMTVSEAIYASKRINKHAPENSAVLERYLVGIKRAFNGEDCHYQHQLNRNLINDDSPSYDPRLLGVSKEFAESHPDFVEFMLSNNIYYQRVRTSPSNEIMLASNEQGEPLLPFAEFGQGNAQEIHTYTRTWAETKADLKNKGQRNDADGTLKDSHHMTMWGLVEQGSYMWDRFTPITRIDPPETPCFQIASYHPQDRLVPGLFDEQGHSGMVFVDKEGFVYSCGFYCHPDSDFYKALKAQASAIRSPDLYEARVDLNWQSMVENGKKVQLTSLANRWNDGVLQFNFEDDAVGAPCLEAVRRTWSREADNLAEGAAKTALAGKAKELDEALAKNSRVADIQKLTRDLFVMMNVEGIDVLEMTAEEKFSAMMGRVTDLQAKTKEAIETGRWDNGALPYSLGENNCTHVSRYYFGQFAEVNLAAVKTPKILNTRPGQGADKKYLPPVKESPFSRLKWAEISVKSHILGKILRVGTLLPLVGSKVFGRGTAAEGFTPITSFWGGVKNFTKAPVSPQQVREEGMALQFNISSATRKILNWLHRPSGILPIYRR